MITAADLEGQLAQCTGSTKFYQHQLGLKFTEGIKLLADEAQCYWLLDAIVGHQINPKIIASEQFKDFQLWVLSVDPAMRNALLACYEDSPSTCDPAITQSIVCTDFPLEEIKLYVEKRGSVAPF